MPTYQYRCTTCDHRFEAVQSFSDASLSTCPVCSGALRKVFSPVGIVLKGSGFYKTDSRSGGSKSTSASTESSTSSESSSPSDSGSSSSDGNSSSEAAPATSSEKKDAKKKSGDKKAAASSS